MTSDLSPVDRLGEIRAREYPPYVALDVGWLLEHIEQLQAEIAACRDAEDFDPNPLIHVYDEMHTERDMAMRMHQVQFERANRLDAQRRAVLDLCDRIDVAWMGQSRHTGTNLPPLGPLVETRAVRAALGDDRD